MDIYNCRTKTFLCIDLKSFYASVECVERGLDPMTTDLVVADPDRSDKTICLAVSPSLKAKGVKNRCRIFEIPKNLKYIVAPPQMQKYINYSAEIYSVYLTFAAPEDIHVYSIDEVFIDATKYLTLYKATPEELALKIMSEIQKNTGVRAACGIGTNLYLAKVALDITAKHTKDFIGILDEKKYRETLWDHKPLTDFWRIGKGTAERLERNGIRTMREIAQTPEEYLYKWFGIDAELIIDHAFGREPTTIADIKAYHSKTNCISSGQVLMRDYTFEEGRLIVKEMADMICLEMTARNVITDSLTLHVGYSNALHAESARGSAQVACRTNADSLIIPAITALYNRIVNPNYTVKRINITCNNIIKDTGVMQLSLFDDTEALEKNRKIQNAVIEIKNKFGKNAILKGLNFENAATARERNKQIGGHKSGEA